MFDSWPVQTCFCSLVFLKSYQFSLFKKVLVFKVVDDFTSLASSSLVSSRFSTTSSLPATSGHHSSSSSSWRCRGVPRRKIRTRGSGPAAPRRLTSTQPEAARGLGPPRGPPLSLALPGSPNGPRPDRPISDWTRKPRMPARQVKVPHPLYIPPSP